MTAIEFKSNAACLTAAQAILNNPAFQQMMAIARAHSPAVERPAQSEMNPSNMAFIAGRCYQHLLTLQTLEDLASPIKISKELIPTFEEQP